MSNIAISQLFLYPVKSLCGIEVDSITLRSAGPDFDRQWMVVNTAGKFLTQRVLPKMCLIETSISNGKLSLHYQNASIEVPPGDGANKKVTVWRDSLNAQDCGDYVAAWLTQILGLECRMVFMPKGEERTAPEGDFTFKSQLGFADAYPLLLAGESSLADLNSHLNKPIAMQRFRPNVVVAGAEAYAEDQWQTILIGGQPFLLASPCTRCVVPAINPATGAKEQEVLDTLNTHRRFGNDILFGQNIVYENEAKISIGELVEVSA